MCHCMSQQGADVLAVDIAGARTAGRTFYLSAMLALPGLQRPLLNVRSGKTAGSGDLTSPVLDHIA